MRSEFNQWLEDLSALAATQNVIIEAKYYDGLEYFFNGSKLTPEQALPQYIDLVKRCEAIRLENVNKNPMDITNYDNYITTKTGVKFRFLDPTPEMINIEDIASGLANKGHFGGQTVNYFSIAQHCLMVEKLVADIYPTNYELRLVALLHDASEAYIGDILKPIKIQVPLFKEIEDKITLAIFERFGLNIKLLPDIKPQDIAIQQLEFDTFFTNGGIIMNFLDPKSSYEIFKHTFFQLYREIRSYEIGH